MLRPTPIMEPPAAAAAVVEPALTFRRPGLVLFLDPQSVDSEPLGWLLQSRYGARLTRHIADASHVLIDTLRGPPSQNARLREEALQRGQRCLDLAWAFDSLGNGGLLAKEEEYSYEARPRINLPPQDGKNRLSRRRSASEIKRDSLVPDSTSAVRPPTPPSDGRGPHRQPSPSSPLFVPAALPAFLMRPRGEALAMSPLADVAQPPISPPRQGLELPPISYILGPAFERQSPPYAHRFQVSPPSLSLSASSTSSTSSSTSTILPPPYPTPERGSGRGQLPHPPFTGSSRPPMTDPRDHSVSALLLLARSSISPTTPFASTVHTFEKSSPPPPLPPVFAAGSSSSQYTASQSLFQPNVPPALLRERTHSFTSSTSTASSSVVSTLGSSGGGGQPSKASDVEASGAASPPGPLMLTSRSALSSRPPPRSSGQSKRKPRLPQAATEAMQAWYDAATAETASTSADGEPGTFVDAAIERQRRYPKRKQRDAWSQQFGLTATQVDDWFINRRRRDKLKENSDGQTTPRQ